MAKYGSAAGRIFVNGTTPSALLQQAEYEKSQSTEDRTAISDAVSYEAFVSMLRGTVSVRGWYDGDWWDTILNGAGFPANSKMAFLPAGDDYSKRATIFSGIEASAKRLIERETLTKLEGAFVGNAGMYDGLVLSPSTVSRGVAGNTDANDVNFGAASASGGVLQLHPVALTLGGYTSVTITMRDSADGITWLAVAGGPSQAITVQGVGFHLPVAVTVRQYVSVAWAWNGAGAGQSLYLLAVWAPYTMAV